MKAQLIHEQQGERTFALIFDIDEEVIEGLHAFAQQWQISAAYLTAVGAFREVTLGYFERERRDYKKILLREQVEVLSLIGNIALHNEQPQIPAHVVVGKSDGTAHGGHLLEARVWPTLEVMLVESPPYLRRKMDTETGLALISPESTRPVTDL
jgi:predicted DNA-binding protein with PD1-like motif